MRLSCSNFREMFADVVILAALGVAGCSNSCFVATSNNGSGTVIVKAASPPPSCSLSMSMGMMNMVAVKTPACTICPATTRVEHAFVTVQSIRLRASDPTDANPAGGLELDPQLTTEPRQIDLASDSADILLEGAAVPAGSYRELRLQFVPEATDGQARLARKECGGTVSNCMVTGDGQVQPLWLAGDPPELVIPFEGNSMAVLPDARVELRLRLRPRVSYVYNSEGWKTETILVGSVEVVRP